MFFIFSKLLDVFLSPLVWVVGFALFSFLLKNHLKRLFRLIALALMILFSNSALFNFVAGSWEMQPVKPGALSDEHRTVVVLGGMASENMHNGLPRFAQSSDRLWQGLYLLKQGYADTMVISGGLGSLFDKQKPEGELLREYLIAVGLKNESIIFESSSRNTYENARNVAALFKKHHLSDKIILVTSAFHMPRAKACFEKQGFEAEPFPADPVSSTRPMQWKDYLVPSGGVFAKWNVLIREWAGIVMYKLNGYI
jgi:uncharacterized SAM-binding protein YcdF (DUF218 family)